MERQMNLGHIIALVVGILIPLLVWGVYVERALEKTKVDITNNKNEIIYLKTSHEKLRDLIINNHDETIRAIHKVDLKLKDKANRN